MHAKTDSEATSFAPSSPDRHPRPMYFVQSPSRASNEGEKIGVSYVSPAMSSPMFSPPLYAVNHSRESSSTSRFSVSGLRKLSPNDVGLRGGGYGNVGPENWDEYDEAEEEGLLEDEESRKGTSLRCYVLMFVVGFAVLFSLFALILWGASKPQKPKIAIRSIKFDRFAVQAGSDNSGVTTDMITVNATVKFTFRNTANFFGVHVSSTPVILYYSQLNIGSGDLAEFYQRRNSARNTSVVVIADKIPLYGNGAHLVTPKGLTTVPVILKLNLTIRSRAHVLGALVKTMFMKTINCSIGFDAGKLNVTIPLAKSCTYGD